MGESKKKRNTEKQKEELNDIVRFVLEARKYLNENSEFNRHLVFVKVKTPQEDGSMTEEILVTECSAVFKSPPQIVQDLAKRKSIVGSLDSLFAEDYCLEVLATLTVSSQSEVRKLQTMIRKYAAVSRTRKRKNDSWYKGGSLLLKDLIVKLGASKALTSQLVFGYEASLLGSFLEK